MESDGKRTTNVPALDYEAAPARPPSTSDAEARSATIALLLATVLWGCGFTWAKAAGESINHISGAGDKAPLGPIWVLVARFVIAGVFKMLLACGHSLTLWMVAHFCATMSVPLFYSCSNAIWYAKVPPHLQGSVLAADQMVGLIIGAIAPLIAGPLADYVFEPAMRPGGVLAPRFGPLFGAQPGAGMALLYAMMSLWIILVGIGGYAFRTLRHVESILPDHDAVTRSG